MAPRKPQPWAKVRAAGIAANKVKNASATSQSAWASLNQQNNEHANRVRALIDRKEQEDLFGDGDEDDADDDEESKKGKKGTAKPKPKPKPKKITKPAKKGKASKPTVATTTRAKFTRSKSKHTTIDEEEDKEDSSEFWRPYGGSETSAHSSQPTSCIGLIRLATWQYPSFKTAIEEVLAQFGAGAELETEEIEHGGESNTDVLARFSSQDQAAIIKEQIEGEEVNGRKLQVRFVEE